MKPVKCPICEGTGKLPDGEPCFGCGSKGWVEVHETDECPVTYGWPPTGSVPEEPAQEETVLEPNAEGELPKDEDD